jgi:hypothetical protein
MNRRAFSRIGVAATSLVAGLALFHRPLSDARYAIPYDLPEYQFPLAKVGEGRASRTGCVGSPMAPHKTLILTSMV